MGNRRPTASISPPTFPARTAIRVRVLPMGLISGICLIVLPHSASAMAGLSPDCMRAVARLRRALSSNGFSSSARFQEEGTLS